MQTELEVGVDRESLFKSLTDVQDWDSRTIVRGDAKVTLHYQGDIDFDRPSIQRRLDRVGALDQVRAEGFMAALWLLSLAAVQPEHEHTDEWADFYQ